MWDKVNKPDDLEWMTEGIQNSTIIGVTDTDGSYDRKRGRSIF